MSNPPPTLPPTPSTIANLPQGSSPLGGGEFVAISQNGVTVKVTSNQFSVVGPAGPTGATGATGATGPTGPAGGAANIGTGTVNDLAYYNTTTTLAALATANSGLLVTSGAGVPSIATAIPNGVTATTQTAADASTKIATTAFVNQGGLTLGTSTATTQSPGDNSTKVATTAYVAANAPSQNYILLFSQTISSSTASVSDTTHITSAYSHYVWEISNLTSVTNEVDALITVQQGGIFIGGSNYATQQVKVGSATVSGYGSNGTSSFNATGNTGSILNTSTEPSIVRFEFWNPAAASELIGFVSSSSPFPFYSAGNANVTANAATTGIKLALSSGNIATCVANLYGIT